MVRDTRLCRLRAYVTRRPPPCVNAHGRFLLDPQAVGASIMAWIRPVTSPRFPGRPALPMNVRSLALVLLLAMLVVSWPAAAPRYMSVDEVRPGMTGIGRTVFEGDRVEEFKVHILGVLRNVIGPRRNLILARLEGGPLANTGVIAGMSGSPVYVDGRLLGAVAYLARPVLQGADCRHHADRRDDRIGRAAGAPRARSPRRPACSSRSRRSPRRPRLRQAFAWFQRPFADRPADIVASAGADRLRPGRRAAPAHRDAARALRVLRRHRDSLSAAFRDSGFVPMPGTAPQSATGARPARRRARAGCDRATRSAST